MHRFRHLIDPADLWDGLIGVAAVAWVLGFVAAIEAALAKLTY